MAGQREVLALVAEAAPLSDVLDRLAGVIEAQSEGLKASFMLADPSAETLACASGPSLPDAYRRAIAVIPIGPDIGSCGTAAHRKKLVAVADIASDPLWRDYRDIALPHGLLACWSAPICSSAGVLLGTFANYYSDIRHPTDDEIVLIASFTRIAAIAIERGRADQALRESEEFNRSILESSTDCIKTLDLDGRLLTINAGGVRIFDIDDVAAFVGSHWVEWWPQESRQIARQAIADGVGGRTTRFQGFCPTARGRVKWWDTVVSPVFGGDGRPLRLIAISRDVTEQKQAETALREGEQKLAAIFNQQFQFMVILTPEGVVEDCNRAAYAGSEVTEHEVIGRRFWEAAFWTHLPHMQDLWRDGVSQAIRTRTPVIGECAYTLRSGRAVAAGYAITAVQDDSGAITHVIIEGTNITHRIRAEASLRDSARKFAAVFNQQFQFMAILTPDGIIEECNEASFRDTGFQNSEIVRRPFWEAPHWSDLPETRRLLENAIRTVAGTGRTQLGECVYMVADGSVHEANYAISAIRGEDGAVEHVLFEARDITKRKEAARHRDLLINELNHRVKNTLASIQSIATQTFRGSAVEKSTLDAFHGRLIALAEAHNLLTEENWDGASLRDIVQRTAAIHDSAAHARFVVEGMETRLPPKRALAFAIAFHELATNALKYGALSNDAGVVRIEWGETDDGRLRLRWIEQGGPAVTKPTRRGFGSRMIERGLAHELGGEVRLDFDPDGISCTFELPLMAEPSAAAAPAPSARAPG